jgi:hypothetical protein
MARFGKERTRARARGRALRDRKERNIQNETLRRAQSGDDSAYVRRQLRSMGHNMESAQNAPFRESVTPQWHKNLGKEVRKFGSTAGTMGGDFGTAIGSMPGMVGIGRFLGSMGKSWDEAQKARRDDKKWTLGGDPLDVTRGSDAYKYLLTQIDDPEDRRDFRREVGKDNLHWTELNKYAGENSAGLAKKINEYNSGIRSFPKGEDVYSDLVGQGKALRDTGMIGDAAARIAEAQAEGRAGFATPEARSPLWWASPDDEYTINTGTPFVSLADEPQNILTPEDLDAARISTDLDELLAQSRHWPYNIPASPEPRTVYDQTQDVDTRTSGPYETEDWMGEVLPGLDAIKRHQQDERLNELLTKSTILEDNKNVLDNLDYSSNPYDAYSGFIRKNLPLGVTPWTNVDPSEFQQGGKYHMDTIFEGGAFDQLTPDQIEELKRGVSESTGLW